MYIAVFKMYALYYTVYYTVIFETYWNIIDWIIIQNNENRSFGVERPWRVHLIFISTASTEDRIDWNKLLIDLHNYVFPMHSVAVLEFDLWTLLHLLYALSTYNVPGVFYDVILYLFSVLVIGISE